MSSPEQEVAKTALNGIADALGKALGREVVIPPQLLGVAADLVLGAVAALGGVAKHHAVVVAQAAAAAIVTDEDAAKELGR